MDAECFGPTELSLLCQFFRDVFGIYSQCRETGGSSARPLALGRQRNRAGGSSTFVMDVVLPAAGFSREATREISQPRGGG